MSPWKMGRYRWGHPFAPCTLGHPQSAGRPALVADPVESDCLRPRRPTGETWHRGPRESTRPRSSTSSTYLRHQSTNSEIIHIADVSVGPSSACCSSGSTTGRAGAVLAHVDRSRRASTTRPVPPTRSPPRRPTHPRPPPPPRRRTRRPGRAPSGCWSRSG